MQYSDPIAFGIHQAGAPERKVQSLIPSWKSIADENSKALDNQGLIFKMVAMQGFEPRTLRI
jgi:hypothetical protein